MAEQLQLITITGKYYMGLLTIMVFATLTTTVTMIVQMRGNDGRPLPHYARLLLHSRVASWCAYVETKM